MENSTIAEPGELATAATVALSRVRELKPRVHCITNEVASNYTANSLLAIGAIPSMTANPVEIADFVGVADSLLINLGTLGNSRIEAIEGATAVALERKLRWCLDPVFVERSATRLQFAKSLVEKSPDVIRANQQELCSLGLLQNSHPRSNEICIAMTAANDLIRQNGRLATVSNGHPLMAQVTATGCALGALVAAFLAVQEDAFTATVGALLVLGICGEIAADQCSGPGSFQNALLDNLYSIDKQTIEQRASLK